MISTVTFTLIFCGLLLVGWLIVLVVVKNVLPLKKAWIVYGSMYIFHAILFGGLILTLPGSNVGSRFFERFDEKKIDSIADVKGVLREQHEEIVGLQQQVEQIREVVWTFALLFGMLGPLLYYNLFKYNLEIEKLSDRRMGSFD